MKKTYISTVTMSGYYGNGLEHGTFTICGDGIDMTVSMTKDEVKELEQRFSDIYKRRQAQLVKDVEAFDPSHALEWKGSAPTIDNDEEIPF